MRHVRMLVLLVVGALAAVLVVASSALAVQKLPKETFAQFKNCPVNAVLEVNEPPFPLETKEVTKCANAETKEGAGGFYTVGGITVNITKPIRLQGAYTKPFGKTTEEMIEFGRLSPIAVPEDGAPAIKPVAETVPGEPFGHISEAEMEEFHWPQSLRRRYKNAQANGAFAEGKTTERIEAAGSDRDYISEFYLLLEENPALIAKVQIQGRNGWLAKLGGQCQIGSAANPIVQELFTGSTESPLTHEVINGTSGIINLPAKANAEIAVLEGTELVDNKYAVPGAEKCGGPANESFLDPVIDRAFGLPAPAGASTTRLIGDFDASSVVAAKEHGI